MQNSSNVLIFQGGTELNFRTSKGALPPLGPLLATGLLVHPMTKSRQCHYGSHDRNVMFHVAFLGFILNNRTFLISYSGDRTTFLYRVVKLCYAMLSRGFGN